MTILLLPLLGGCFRASPDGGVPCTREARASVQVSLASDSGSPVAEATVTWAAASGDAGACEWWPDGDSWVCGWEQQGEVTVTAGAPGHTPAHVVTVVRADECHVVTEQVTLVLAALDCTDELVASVQLHVTASTGGPVGEAVAYYVPSDEDWTTPGLCDPGLDGLYWCGWERSGDLDVWVHAPGWTTWAETIRVRHDGCHPITENRPVLLYPS